MLTASLVAVALAAAALVAGVSVGDVDLVLLSIAGALASGGLLSLGLARNRPGRYPRAPRWAGATDRPEEPIDPADAVTPPEDAATRGGASAGSSWGSGPPATGR